jgi:hypothetical protein
MRLSASRIRSLSIRHARAEEAAFPGIRTARTHFPYNLRPDSPDHHADHRFRSLNRREGPA